MRNTKKQILWKNRKDLAENRKKITNRAQVCCIDY